MPSPRLAAVHRGQAHFLRRSGLFSPGNLPGHGQSAHRPAL